MSIEPDEHCEECGRLKTEWGAGEYDCWWCNWRTDGDGDDGAEHLDDVPDGCGCVETWEHLSEERRE